MVGSYLLEKGKYSLTNFNNDGYDVFQSEIIESLSDLIVARKAKMHFINIRQCLHDVARFAVLQF